MAGRLNWTTVGGETREGPVTKRGGLGEETRVAKIVELFIRLRKEKRKPSPGRSHGSKTCPRFHGDLTLNVFVVFFVMLEIEPTL